MSVTAGVYQSAVKEGAIPQPERGSSCTLKTFFRDELRGLPDCTLSILLRSCATA